MLQSEKKKAKASHISHVRIFFFFSYNTIITCPLMTYRSFVPVMRLWFGWIICHFDSTCGHTWKVIRKRLWKECSNNTEPSFGVFCDPHQRPGLICTRSAQLLPRGIGDAAVSGNCVVLWSTGSYAIKKRAFTKSLARRRLAWCEESNWRQRKLVVFTNTSTSFLICYGIMCWLKKNVPHGWRFQC